MASGGGDKVTSTPASSKPPRLDHDASRILGYVRTTTVRQPPNAPDSTLAGESAMSTQVRVGVGAAAAEAGASSSSSSSSSTSSPSAAAMVTSLSNYSEADKRRIIKSRYLQPAFLSVTAAEHLVKQRKQLTDQLDSLLAYQDALINRESDLRFKENAATTKLLVAESIDSHLQLLDIVSSGQLSSIVEPSEALDAAVTASMQALPVDNVILPENDAEWTSLLQMMEESCKVDDRAGEFIEAVTQEAKYVRELSDVMREQTAELHTMTEKMNDLAKLVDKEACLRIDQH